jgi:hypothetical protein
MDKSLRKEFSRNAGEMFIALTCFDSDILYVQATTSSLLTFRQAFHFHLPPATTSGGSSCM